MREPGVLLSAVAALLMGLNAGFFFTWSFTIMQSLDLIAAEQAIETMRAINANIRNGWFGLIFFGAPVVLTGLGIYALVVRRGLIAFLAGCALVCFLGCCWITLTMHVPWNAGLAETSFNNDNVAEVWRDYSNPWISWNHLRTLACVTSLCFILATLYQWRRIRYISRMPV